MKALTTPLFTLLLAALSAALLGGCATAPVTNAPQLFNDALFQPNSQKIDVAEIFAVSPEMRAYLHSLSEQLVADGKQQGLMNALYRKDQLKLEYDSAVTRTASQAFASRSGNCLSLTIMTAALAREIGLQVHFQSVATNENWSRSGGIYFSSGHVNLTLGKKQSDPRVRFDESHLMTIDFFPLTSLEVQQAWAIQENTIIAMFMNNRAGESLAQGKVNDAYWWAREGIKQDPNFLTTYNTLGVIYRRHGNLREAEQTLKFQLERDPLNTQAMSNMVLVLADLGRTEESAALKKKLALIEPNQPYHFFNIGQAAIRAGDFKTARDMFFRELSREPSNAEFHFWMAVAFMGLGNATLAQEHLKTAMENSSTRHDHDVYAAKLDRIKSIQHDTGNNKPAS